MAAAIRNCGEYDFHSLVVPLAQPLAVPIGVHLANRSRGSLGGSIGRSYLVTGLGLIAGATLGAEEAQHGWLVTMGVIAAAQLAISVAVEQRSTNLASPRVPTARPDSASDSERPASIPRIAGGALLGLVAGSIPLVMSLAICDNASCGAEVLFAIGIQPLGAPLGASFANRDRGSLAMTIGASYATTIVGLVALQAVDSHEAAERFALSIPIAQVLVATAIERVTTLVAR
jgi:hypothetical protein